jgi:putative acetyltransferase
MDTIRILQSSDRDALAEVYHDAVITQASGLYSTVQLQAWADHGWQSNAIDQALADGYGLASCSGPEDQSIEAFGILCPIDRLSLLYCRGRSCRQGRSRAILGALEIHAREAGCSQLRTEASQLSRPLLTQLGWQVEAQEEVRFAGVLFIRWRMIKTL